MRTATPNDVYTQQGAKPACQEDTNAKFSHLLLAQLPRTQFTHSKLPNPHARKTPTQNFRTSYWHSYPERRLHTASCQTRMPGRPQRKIFAPPIGTATPNTIYTQQGAKPACQEDITAICSHLLLAGLPPTTFTHSKVIYTQQAAKPFLEAPNTAPATQTASAAHGDQPFLEVPSIAPATQTGAAAHGDQARRNPFWRLQVLRLPRGRQEPRPTATRRAGAAATRRAATLSGGSKYCAAAHGDQARRNPFWRLQVLRLPHRQEPRPRRLQVLRLPHNRTRRPGAPQPFLEALTTAPATQTGAAARRPRAQPFLKARSTAPATQTGAAAHGDQARRNLFWRLQVLRLPHGQEPRPTTTRRAATLSGGSKYCACHTDRSRGPRRPSAPQPFLEALSTAPATRTGAAAHGDQARRNPF